MNRPEEKYCIATVTSESFLPGTLVMIHTFLKYNPWFNKTNGDVVIIHDGLSPGLRELAFFENVAWLQVSDTLKKKVDTLCNGVPHLDLEHKKKRFYSLELFRLTGYRKVLFCDSDVLFLGNISELFTEAGESGPLLCCGDLNYYEGTPVDAVTFIPPVTDAAKLIEKTFNAGFMIVDRDHLAPHHYDNLVALLDVTLWQRVASPRTDQVIYNLYFQNRCRFLGARYNYLLAHADTISRVEPVSPQDIKVLHFNGGAKPWDSLGIMGAAVPDASIIAWVKMWQREYLDFLPHLHLHSRLKGKGKQEAADL